MKDEGTDQVQLEEATTQGKPMPLNVDVISDVVCPWCYIGLKNLEAAAKMVPELDLQVRWRAFLLNPQMPTGGMDRADYVAGKFGGKKKAKQFYDNIAKTGEAVGIDFRFDLIKIMPDSSNAHRLIHWSSSAGPKAQTQLVAALFEAFFIQGENIGDIPVLIDVGKRCGMDAEIVENLLNSERDNDHIKREVSIAQNMGVSGVPVFVVENQYAAMGAQPAKTLAESFLHTASLIRSTSEEHQDRS